MRRIIRSLFAFVLCMCLCVNFIMPAFAANENNALGVTFSATLDTPCIPVSEVDQTVVMRVNTSEGVLLDGIGADIVWDSPLTIASITNDDSRINFTGSVNPDNGRIRWAGTDELDQLSDVTCIATVTFTVPANTPAGSYTVGVENIELTENYGDIWENSASAIASLTITESTPEEEYTANISVPSNEVSVGDTVMVNVGISHSTNASFAAGEVVINYDNTKLRFNKVASTLGTATVQENAGILTFEDYGTDKNFGNDIYVLAFDAIADGEADITLTSAAFVNKENAAKSDLIPAALSPAFVNLTISKRAYPVTLPNIFIGELTATQGEAYTFSVADGNNYDYGLVTATVDGEAVMVTDNGDGTYTISNVTGEVVISGTRTEKIYVVTFAGNAAADITDGTSTAIYNTNYTFTMPSVNHWVYSLESMTIGGVAYTGYSVANSVYTIPGSAINGNIVITVSKVQTEASVTVEGSGAGAAVGYNAEAVIGEDYTLTIVPESGFSYNVAATMNGAAVTVVDNGDSTYTIQNVSGNVVFTVERTVITDGVSVTQYLTLNGTIMWLVKNKTELADGKVPTYDGQNMYWAEKYGTYCYLVVAQTLSTDEAAAKVGITDGTAVAVDYGMDVNMTGKNDASDSQLTYNMYNALYSGITEDVTIEKYLRADVNADGKINVEDATAIIAALLA